MKKSLLLIAISSALLMSTGCTKNSVKKQQTLALDSITAQAPNIDLAQRQGWILSASNKKYSYTVSNNTIYGVPANEPYLATIENSGTSAPNFYSIYLSSPAYFKNHATAFRKLYAESPIEPFPLPFNIEDQSTKEKLLNADILSAFAQTLPTKHLNGINLVHGSTLLDFETSGLPAGSIVSVKHAVESIPYNYKPDFYKVITARYWPEIIVHFGSDSAKVAAPATNGMFSNAIYKFRLIYDPATKKLSTRNVTETKWSDVADW